MKALQERLGVELPCTHRNTADVQEGLNVQRMDSIDRPRGDARQPAYEALEMGLCWEHGVSCKYYVRAELCYDIHYFFKQNQMLRLITKPLNGSPTYFSDQGDLALSGGSFSVTVGF